MALRTVVVVAVPTGPTGTYERVNIYAGFTGPTGPTGASAFETCLQATGNTGVHGQFQRVYPSGGPTAGVRNIIISGYVGATGT
jgi:hypothetical protein